MTIDTYEVDSKGRYTIKKDPNAVLDYSWDWTAWLDAIPDTINSVTVTGQGINIDSTMVIGKVVTSFISGGTIGDTAKATCHIVTTGGRQEDRSIYFNILER